MQYKFLWILLIVSSSINSSVTIAEEVEAEFNPSPYAIEQLNLANKLIALGDARKDPIFLIAGATIQKNIGIAAPNSQHFESVQSDDVLIRAKKYAGSNKVMVNLVEDVIAMRSKSYRLDCNGFHRGPCNEAVIY
jgi:hypothetical protein